MGVQFSHAFVFWGGGGGGVRGWGRVSSWTQKKRFGAEA